MYLQAAKKEAEPDVLSHLSKHQAERDSKMEKVNLLGYRDKQSLGCKSGLRAQGRWERSRQAVQALSRVTALHEVC